MDSSKSLGKENISFIFDFDSTRPSHDSTRKIFDDFDSTQTQSVYDSTNITPTHACYLVMAKLSFTFGFKSPRIEALGSAFICSLDA